MTRHADLDTVVAIYARLPGVSKRPSQRDFAVAHHLLLTGLTLSTIRAAMILATLRRNLSNPEIPLEPVRSIAYYKPLAQYLHDQPLEPGYLEYLAHRFRQAFPGHPSPLA